MSVSNGVGIQRCKSRFGPLGILESSASTRRQQRDVDMTSMADVTFLLLIFFMVTASFHLQKSIAVPPQHSDVAGSVTDDLHSTTITLQVDERGSFFVMTPDWEFEPIGRHKLILTLKRAVSETRQRPRMDVQVHEAAKLDALVVALDAGAEAGVTDIQVTQVDYL